MSAISQPQLSVMASLHSHLLRLKSTSFMGIIVSQVDAPMSIASSTALLVLIGREFFTCSNLFFIISIEEENEKENEGKKKKKKKKNNNNNKEEGGREEEG